MNTNMLAERAKAAVKNAYRQLEGKNANPIFTQEMFDLLQEQDPDSDDPLCLFHYFGLQCGDWYVFAAERMGRRAVNIHTGESAEGLIQFTAFVCLGDPTHAEVGIVPLDKCSGMGLRDIPPLFPGVAAVELDRYFTPQRLSVIHRRVKGYDLASNDEEPR